jgi:hypothetical protein
MTSNSEVLAEMARLQDAARTALAELKKFADKHGLIVTVDRFDYHPSQTDTSEWDQSAEAWNSSNEGWMSSSDYC